ncbi:hypothetical protein EGR_11167 [Echinococcus granulosus]|uniref:Uncharacterized protein n=1 Tax=Echinococcus granulosus TaxID=6210 RepID=W6U0M0_ECHGR|nr:hypothetical protein EGR_11167 [Echinococcus granulosus]EUB53976.1 hypothetical protein EGR_11167 [Echinococcus granulosus]
MGYTHHSQQKPYWESQRMKRQHYLNGVFFSRVVISQ